MSDREPAVIKVSVMYPNTPGARFNHEYYRDKHMPLVKARMGDACKSYTVDKGLAGGATRRSGDVCWNVSHLLRLDRRIPGWFWASCQRDHGRHPKLYRSVSGHPNQ